MKSLKVRVCLLCIPAFSQTPETKPSFEVATVKRNVALEGGRRIADQPGARFIANRATLRMLMGFAGWGNQIVNAPAWLDSDLWDVEAKAAEGTVLPSRRIASFDALSPLAPMVQSLLEEHFHLKLHYETRELPVFDLTLAKGGPTVKLSEDQSPPVLPEPGIARPQAGAPIPRGAMSMGRGDFSSTATSIPDFVRILSALYVHRTVIDKTGLKGLYDFKLTWTPDGTSGGGIIGTNNPVAVPTSEPDPSAVSIFTAIQEQLGLKLESSKGPVQVIVIDHIERPQN